MNTIGTTLCLSYPGLIRAFNRIEMCPADKSRKDMLQFLTDLIETAIQKDLEELFTSETQNINISINATQKQVETLLELLKQNNVKLYNGISNEEALIVNKYL